MLRGVNIAATTPSPARGVLRCAAHSRVDRALKIFISHAHADKSLAREGYLALQRAGFDPFLDDVDLRPAQNLRIELERHLNDAAYFVLFWSRHCNRDWVQWELKQALERALTTGLRIVVAVLDGSERPEQIRHHLYIDLTSSLRVGLAQLASHLGDPGIKVLPIQPKDEFFRPNMEEVSWFLVSQREHARNQKWKLVVGDAGLFNVLAQVYSLPPQADPGDIDNPLEDVRRTYLQDVEHFFEIGEEVATTMLKTLISEDAYSRNPEGVPLESCRHFLAWLMASGMKQATKWLTHAEFRALDADLNKRLRSLWSRLEEMSNSGLARSYSSEDPIDLLFGTEVPLDPQRFIMADLLFQTGRSVAGSDHVALHLQKSRAPVTGWADRLMEEDWPPPSWLLDDRGWALLFVPQIARDVTLSLWSGRGNAQPLELAFAFRKEAYGGIGLH